MALPLANASKPISPSDIAIMNQYGFVMTMISQPFEKDPPPKQRELKGLDVNVHSIFMPCVYPNRVGQQTCEQSIEEK